CYLCTPFSSNALSSTHFHPLSLHDALPISPDPLVPPQPYPGPTRARSPHPMTSTVPNAVEHADEQQPPITMFGPDFPYAYDDFLAHPAGLGQVPATEHGTEVAVIDRKSTRLNSSHVK